MEIDLQTIHSFIRTSHIVAGCVALILFWIPVLAKKGAALHIRSGADVLCGARIYIAATAAVSCILGAGASPQFYRHHARVKRRRSARFNARGAIPVSPF